MSLRLPTLDERAVRPTHIAQLRAELAKLDLDEAIDRIGARQIDRALKTTISLCPECLQHVPALVFEREQRVIIAKRCRKHGPSEAVLENDARFYHLSNKDHNGRHFAPDRIFQIPEWKSPDGNGAKASSSCCGPAAPCGSSSDSDQLSNRSCTVLVEVTDACNLACRVCYSDAKGDRYLPLDSFVSHIERLLEQKGQLESVQLTGGEASLHPQFWDMVEYLHREPRVTKVYVPTNGLLFAKSSMVDRAEQYADKLMMLLQFDGLSSESNHTLRGADPLALRQTLIERLSRAGIPMQLTMTIAQDVNENELGAVIDYGLEHKMVKVIALQPVTWSGRFDLAVDPMRRLTLSDIAQQLLDQAKVRAKREDFVPIPCSHPNCGWITVFLRRFGLVHNILPYVDLDRIMNDVAYKTLLSTTEIRNVVGTPGRGLLKKVAAMVGGKVIRSTDMFSVAIKPFMDRYSYDQDRIDNCCHHITDTQGELRSFCEYNALDRQHDPWTHLPTLETLGNLPGLNAKSPPLA